MVAAICRPHRARLISGSARVRRRCRRAAVRVGVVRQGVSIDAPCSGLGALRRRADARWRITESDVGELAGLQREIIDAAAPLVRPGGWLVYSVCTLTAEESIDHPIPHGFEVDQPPPSDRVATVRARLAGAATRPRHRRHGADSIPSHVMSDDPLQAKVLTVSDGVSTAPARTPAARRSSQQLTDAGWNVVEHRVTADGVDNVANTLREMCGGFAGLIVSTGGTGFAPRDQTPEGTRAVIEREAPGLAEAMRLVNPLGRLSRGIAGDPRAGDHLQHTGFTKGMRRAARARSSTSFLTRCGC